MGYADTLFPTAAWEGNKGVLARDVNDERLWEALAALYSCAPHTSDVIADQEPGAPLDDQMHDAISRSEDLARFAYETLVAESHRWGAERRAGHCGWRVANPSSVDS